ncbi:response regulator [Paenibacillus tritici]|uniref:Response regulator n=1 Tax=Paenibacillus tritici TaxID=1873425 RepID=A0ABX2DJ55_9BACL|nr:response regulator [Paenibacillus tritici]NQX44652.1 response regulator [Paenibacillus tritici]
MKYKVLIVDDEPLILKSLQTSIHWSGMDCEVIGTAEDGEEALELMQSELPDILLTDISMPGMNGIELLEQISRWPERPEVIILSGYSDFEYARKGLQYRVFDYILKPIDPLELEKCIHSMIAWFQEKEQVRHSTMKQQLYDAMMGSGFDSSKFHSTAMYRAAVILADDSSGLHLVQGEGMATPEGLRRFVYATSKRYAVVVFYIESEKAGFAEWTAAELQYLGSLLGDDKLIAAGSVVSGLAELAESYEEAVGILDLLQTLNSAETSQHRVWTMQEVDQSLSSRKTPAKQIGAALAYMNEHYREDLAIDQVAKHVAMSTSHLSALLKQMTGSTFLEHMTEMRIHQACMLLSGTNMKTYEIANQVGYTDQRYFSQVFKRKMNMTPSEYRAGFSRNADV